MPKAEAILTGENITLETHKREIHACFNRLGTVKKIIDIEQLTEIDVYGETVQCPAIRVTAEVTPHPDTP